MGGPSAGSPGGHFYGGVRLVFSHFRIQLWGNNPLSVVFRRYNGLRLSRLSSAVPDAVEYFGGLLI